MKRVYAKRGSVPRGCGKRTQPKVGCFCAGCEARRKHNAAGLRAHRRKHPTYVKRMNLRAYGLSHEAWLAMLEAQDGVCAVCGNEETGENQHGRMALAVDHDHSTGRVRALLCHRCNRALGLLGDDAERVRQLYLYRRKF